MRSIAILALALLTLVLLAFAFSELMPGLDMTIAKWLAATAGEQATGAYLNADFSFAKQVAMILGLPLLYFFPTLVLHIRGARDELGRAKFAIGNLLAAWSGIGWLILLIAAFVAKKPGKYDFA